MSNGRRRRLIPIDYVAIRKQYDNENKSSETEQVVVEQKHETEVNEEDVSRVEFRVKNPTAKSRYANRAVIQDDDLCSPHPDDLLAAQYEVFGTTPPRTRMKIKNRDWERKQKSLAAVSGTANEAQVPKRGVSRMARSRVLRRNTMDCALLNEMFVNEEKRNDKRLQSLLRDSEREMKNSFTGLRNFSYSSKENSFHDSSIQKIESLDKCTPLNSELSLHQYIPKVVECSNRYMCVSSRQIGCRASAPPSAFQSQFLSDARRNSPAQNRRKEFHETFANLIKLGSIDRPESKISHEESTWQTELKDLIWLELQAWQADRTMEQQDRHLFEARKAVPDLLTQIINYQFQPRYQRELSNISSDSGIESGSNIDANLQEVCPGCMSLYCKDCLVQQEIALKEVEDLLNKLEAAEALYPSSQVMGAFHPIYKSEGFIARIKTMCLWYNITNQNQLKLRILGKILARLQNEKFSWPVQTSYIGSESNSATSSKIEYDDSGINSIDSNHTDGCVSIQRKTSSFSTLPKVHFLLRDEVSTYAETSSSNDSDNLEIIQHIENQSPQFCKNSIHDINIFSVEPLDSTGGSESNPEHSSALYRKFIENVLKSRGLAKALSFLHKLHNVVLHKAHISLEKPGTEEYDFETELMEEDVPRLEPDINREQIIELRRYGYWSEEAKTINLPTYIPSFVFLSGIPLQFMHEFLRMRLETRPVKPNPLSLEQLMKELREGLTLALTHRERYQRHITTALVENEKELERYMGILNHFDATVKKVFELYLDYIDQLVLGNVRENNQKSALEKEWMFTKLISPMISGMHTIAGKKFCDIISKLLSDISDRLVNRSAELDTQIEDTAQNEEVEMKWKILNICRETQSLFTTERERTMKVLFFAKTFCRDVEATDFHREHYEHDVAVRNKDFVCIEIKEAFKLLQRDILNVCKKLTTVIERVQERCHPSKLRDLEDQDRQAVLSRSREILHQGYKFGFEYHKDVIRLLEHRIIINKDEECEVNLSLGIIVFAKMWMQFVTERCERGRGVRPRWASQGLEFLILACDPQLTQHLNEKEFEELKQQMDCCISHVIGITSEPEKNARKKSSPRTRKTSSPAASRSRTPTRLPLSAGIISNTGTSIQSPPYNKFLHPQFSLKEEVLQTAINGDNFSTLSSEDSPDFSSSAGELINDLSLAVPDYSIHKIKNVQIASRQSRVRDAVTRLEEEKEEQLRQKNLIGQVKELISSDKIHLRARSVNFRWHRGKKIGQGQFGKVYTAVNNNTGELMAMKEISIPPGESRALKNVADELKILEGIRHKNLVRYYGIEVHREEILIFMELCSEGTLETLVGWTGGLPEGLTRRFTAQLLAGVSELHKHGIVHRDIKTANIFLVDGSNSLKLGDFGSAIKIQAHTTVPGELQGYVGTQAYMAPEMFTKNNGEGHGRAADIWSVGCVVVEMASGKRPWSQFDSNYQIMFKVGMGEKPEAPDSLSQEGHDFVSYCLQHDPKLRKTALELLEHNFCKYGREDDCTSEDNIRRSFRRNNIKNT